ncbi:T7SS effector LXG polymorphic toxin [Alkalihalobacillus oceani]|uniref:T7SS effector LXG polymorphic toxin n=1 Tax=Halalkalibacter oceani TaxID=1653776 RepID=A0A9X2IP36_9BACI|nr:T7SS effector LXG polymorphic toxin [Halalkalibacter oceani]MCM3714441.1 T7SS effector LXG polymorphic toxin [Halalkalibacter oceani]
MKVVDTYTLRQAISDIQETIDKQTDQFTKLELTIQSFVSLNSSFLGRAGESIRSFYQVAHLPFIQSFKDFLQKYQLALQQIDQELQSLEPYLYGYIREDFLAGDVKQGLLNLERTVTSLTDTANAVLTSVQDILYLPPLSDAHVLQGIHEARIETDTTIEQVYRFDHKHTEALNLLQTDIQTLTTYINDTPKCSETGQLRVSSFTPGQLTYRTSHLWLQTQISESVSDQETPSSPSTWREAGSAILDFLPFFGNIKAGVEALTGKDAITGRHLEGWERVLAGAAIIGGSLAKGVSRGIKGIGKGEQVLDKVKTYEQARNKVLVLVGDLGPNSQPYTGKLRSSTGYGQVVGRQSADGKVRWRLDYDPNKGTHINIEDFRNGKGANARKIAIPFEGNESTFKSLLKYLNR